MTLSQLYDGVLEDMLTAELGVGWRHATTRAGQRKVEIEGVPDAVIAEFSQRRREIDAIEDALTVRFTAGHGRAPSPAERRRLAQQANLQTRRDKQRRSLAQMTEEWRGRARPMVGEDIEWVETLTRRCDLPALHAADFTPAMVADLARSWRYSRSSSRRGWRSLNTTTAQRTPRQPSRSRL